ncbi:MAG: hypothetical protein M1423_02655 [Acidobacteria bacterium]|nr:hypothetical protein [Acidobacteriota bacterium]
MNNTPVSTARKTNSLICVWVPTGLRRTPLACVWMADQHYPADCIVRLSSIEKVRMEETERMPPCL